MPKMMRLILENQWQSLNSNPVPSSFSDGLRNIIEGVAGSEDDQIDQLMYSPLTDLNEPDTTTGFSGNETDYSTKNDSYDSGGDFGNGTNATGVVFLSGEYIFDRSNVKAIFLVLYTIVFCSCFFGNLMVILVVTLHWRMRSITNFCLANLAIADLCVGIFCVYQNLVTYLMDSWVFGEFMCKMYHFINSLSTTASVLILVVICIERYLAIIHPMTCKQMLTLNRLRITIVFVWILSAAISSPRFYYFNTTGMHMDGQYSILCYPNRTKYNSKLMDMISLTVLFLIPLTIITILYTHIGIVLWKSSKNRMPTSTPSESISSSSSGCYYRETDHNILQTVRLTLLPVAVSSQNQQQPPNNHRSISGGTAATLHGVISTTPPSPPLLGASSATQQPERYSFFTSPFICLQCRNKSKKHQRHKRRHTTNSRKLGRMTTIQNGNGTPSPVGSRACMANVAINDDGTAAAGGGVQELIVNCKACQHPYMHRTFNSLSTMPATDEEVETTSFIQSCHNHKEDCVTPANNSKNTIEHWQQDTRNDATDSPKITGCCNGSRTGRIRRPINICFRKQGSKEKSVTFQTVDSPPSPFCSRNCACVTEGKCSKTEPIVLVKFEKKKNQSSKKGSGSMKTQCTILMNEKSCHGRSGTVGAGVPCNGNKRGISGGGEFSMSGGSGDGLLDEKGRRTIAQPKFDCAICNPSTTECCGESGESRNDNRISSEDGIPNESLRGLRNHNHHNNSLRRNFSFEHKRNLSMDSGISGMPTTGRCSNIEGGPCDQNFDRHNALVAVSGVCGAACPSCGTSCSDSHQLLRCSHHNQNNFISSSQKLSHFGTSTGGSSIPGVKVAAPSAPKRIRRMRVIRSSKYGSGALQSRRRIIRMLIVVVLAFALCHLPFHARKVWQYWSPKWFQYEAGSVFSHLFTPLTFLIMYANSAINPILYAFMSKKFRMSFKDLLCCNVRNSLRINRNASVRSTHAVALSSQTTGTGL